MAPKRILAIFAFSQALPWSYTIEKNLRTSFASDSGFPIELNVEHADMPRHPDKTYLRKMIDFYKYKYANQRIDLILALGDESVELLIESGEELFGDTPVVLVTTDIENSWPDTMKTDMTSMVWGWDMENNIKLIPELFPQIKQLYIISGTATSDLMIRKQAVDTLEKLNIDFSVNYIVDFVASEMLEKVRNLPKNSVIFYLTVLRDINNQYFVPRELMHLVSEKANAPTFGIVGTYLGHGVLGGILLSAEKTGKRVASVAVKFLKGESVTESELKDKKGVAMFDWRQLKRWSVNEDSLPPGSIVKFREFNAWQRYRGQIIGALALVLFQSLVIFYLLHQRRELRRVEKGLLQTEQEAKFLAGRLLNAQESERAHIARELHDDITQRVAALNIQIDTLEMQHPSLQQPVKEKLQQIGTGLGDLSSDIHMISRQLHPSVLYDLGLIKAIETECNNFAKLRGISPTLDLDTINIDFPKEKGLCIYRILQEGLRNIGKHARATKVDVRLNHKKNTVCLIIMDNGIGFDPYLTKKKAGIGLASMVERARLINGDLSIESRPGEGTGIKLKLSVPPQKNKSNYY